MTSDLKEYKLGNICEILSSKRIFAADYVSEGIPFYRSKEIIQKSLGREIDEKLYISTDKFDLIKKHYRAPTEGDILISAVGERSGIPYLVQNETFYFKDGNLIWLRNFDKSIIDSHYLCYWFKSMIGQSSLNNLMIGSAQRALTIIGIKGISIKLPPLEIQRKIAKVLSAIDDKIELNNSINNNLEQQAQTIFKENISKNCNYTKNGCIGDYCSVKSGFAFKGTWWQDYGVKVIKIKTIDNDTINFNDCSYVSDDKIQYAKDFIVQGGDLLIAMTGATIGKFAVIPKINEQLLVNQRVGKFFLGTEPLNRLAFLYCSLKQQDIITEIINRGQGSAQPNISSTDIMTTPCYLPNKCVIDEFNELCKPIFETIITNKYENEQLANLRDTLLPKLMSGEIDVSNVDISTDKLSFSEDK